MAVLKVNPNRMEVLRLRKRLQLSRRGHSLLKQKQDELMKILTGLMDRASALRKEVDEKTSSVYRLYFFAEAYAGPIRMKNVRDFSPLRTEVESGRKRILNLRVPEITIRVEGEKPPYGFLNTTGALDEAIEELRELIPKLGKLYEIETQLGALAEEVEKTRRRVNALEHILIPSIEQTIKTIIMKLDEIERGNRVRLMKVKELAENR